MEWTEVIKLKVIKQWSKPLVARTRDISETLSLAESQHCAEKLKWRISEKKKPFLNHKIETEGNHISARTSLQEL